MLYSSAPSHFKEGATKLRLDLVESVFAFKQSPDLKDVVIIGAQHILPSTLTMLRSFFDRGLSPAKVFLLGKCYSTDYETYNELRHLGAYVHPSSLEFDKARSFDSVYSGNIKLFVDRILENHSLLKNQLIVVLDDGGELIYYLNNHQNTENLRIVALEQTSSGYEKLKHAHLNMSVVNVARSYVKTEYESKIVIQTAIKAFYSSMVSNQGLIKNVLIFGNGALGNILANVLEGQFNISIFDIDPKKSDLSREGYLDNLTNFDLIVGCVGKTILSANEIKKLKPGTILVSLSSSDREFDISELRRNALDISSCHNDFICPNGVRVLNCGFPINFSGDASCVDIEEFELTRALLTLGALQAIELSQETGLFPLNLAGQAMLVDRFSKKYSQKTYV
jgi:hypothetical protein